MTLWTLGFVAGLITGGVLAVIVDAALQEGEASK